MVHAVWNPGSGITFPTLSLPKKPGPSGQAESSKSGLRHAVPLFTPLWSYFHIEPSSRICFVWASSSTDPLPGVPPATRLLPQLRQLPAPRFSLTNLKLCPAPSAATGHLRPSSLYSTDALMTPFLSFNSRSSPALLSPPVHGP